MTNLKLINKKLFQEFRPNLVKLKEEKMKEYQKVSSKKKEEMKQQEANSVFPETGESLSISIERIMVEKFLADPMINEEDKKHVQLFWGKHQQLLLAEKLEEDPQSEYIRLYEAMTYYKIYQALGENGILEFIKNYDFDKLSKIKKYSDPQKKILSQDYKNFLEMSGEKLVENFIRQKKEK